ncbi:hypothetical protein AGMMS49941_03060 [Deferribacterales bacterium]|nr:hypothetical protein AGMMS49941_03060 [Deferribacterales bacterium]
MTKNTRYLLLTIATIVLSAIVAAYFFKLPSGNKDDKKIALSDIATAITGKPQALELRAQLARSAPLSTIQLERLAYGGYASDVAANPNITAALLEELFNSSESDVRAAAASNPNLTLPQLRRAVADSYSQVRAAVADNPNLTDDMMTLFANDADYAVRSAFLGNPNITQALINIIEPSISEASCDNRERIYAGHTIGIDALEYNANNPDPCVRRGVARNKNTPRRLVATLIADEDATVRINALKNPRFVPDELFVKGWQRESEQTRLTQLNAALANPSISLKILSIATRYPDRYGIGVASNPNVKMGLLTLLYDYSKPKGGLDGFFNKLEDLAADPAFIARLTALGTVGNGDWRHVLRDIINQSFIDDIYNPVLLSHTISGNDDDAVLFSPGEYNAGADTFAELTSNPTAGQNKDNSGRLLLRQMVETADTIVSAVMGEMTPAMEAAINGQEYPPTGVLVIEPNSQQQAGNTPQTAIEVAARPEVFRSVLTLNLYNNCKKQLLKLQSMI